MATAGFIIMFMKSASKPPNPEAMKQLIAHFNANGGELYSFPELDPLLVSNLSPAFSSLSMCDWIREN